MRVRARALRLHFFVGTITGAALIVLGLSGAALVFRPELEAARTAARAPATSDAPLLPLQALADAARRRHPGFIVTDLLLPDDRTVAARVRMLDRSEGQVEVLVDAHTGETLGSFWLERSPLHALRLLHAERYLGSRGTVAVGVLGLWLLLQGVTGLYLSWPLVRRPRWGLHVRWSRPWPVVGRDVHKALGAASILFHLPIAATGAALGLSAILSGAPDNEATASRSVERFGVSLDALARGAEAAIRGGRITALHLSPHGGTVAAKLRTPGDLDARGASVVILDAFDAQVLRVRDARQGSRTARVFTAVRALHVGDVGGSLARTLYVLGGLASVSVALSGYALVVARPGRLERVRAVSP